MNGQVIWKRLKRHHPMNTNQPMPKCGWGETGGPYNPNDH